MNLYIDIDDTITLSKKRFVEIYNQLHNTNYDYRDVKTWSFDNIKGITPQEVETIFSMDDFYDSSKICIHTDCIATIDFLSKHYTVKFVTIGNSKNLLNKQFLMAELFPNIEYIGVNHSSGFTKGDIVKDGIMIDDNSKLLDSTHAQYKLLFKPDGDNDYNQGLFPSYTTWFELLEELILIKNGRSDI